MVSNIYQEMKNTSLAAKQLLILFLNKYETTKNFWIVEKKFLALLSFTLLSEEMKGKILCLGEGTKKNKVKNLMNNIKT